MRISDWSSDVCSSDLIERGVNFAGHMEALRVDIEQSKEPRMSARRDGGAVVRVERRRHWSDEEKLAILKETTQPGAIMAVVARRYGIRSEEHTSELQSLMRISSAVFCLKQKTHTPK